MSYAWTCSCCGKNFDTLPLSYAFDGPRNWHAMTEDERITRVKKTSDICIIDEQEFYIRGCIEVPVLETTDHLVWGVWVSVSQESFRYIHEKWDEAIPDDEPPRFGWLCNWISGYPEPEAIKCHVFLRSNNLRPRIVLEPTDYPLAIEQHRGITLDRVKELAARSHA